MNTPICDFVSQYAASEPLRLHMPGHKGISLLGMESRDITEIPGADVLYHPEGIIRESEENAASLFGTARTVYSTEGSSLPIRAMLYLASLYAAANGRKPKIAAGRNAHKVFITAAALLDLDVTWLYPENTRALISCEITPQHLEAELDAMETPPTAVYLTSPDYLGNMTDIRQAAAICHKRGIILLVDNAHGAYLNFLPECLHPIALGADLCCDSAHKTLPVLTGGAYLHISRNAHPLFAEAADRAMALFASTSPSYLIMQSLDQANRYLAEGYREKLVSALGIWNHVRQELIGLGFSLTGMEPLKITVLPKPYGWNGEDLSALLEAKGIYSEFADQDHLVWMLSPEFSETDAQTLLTAMASIPRKEPIQILPPELPRLEQVLRPHQALFAPTEEIPASQSISRIMASPTVSCPPAIPIVSCGERITPQAAAALAYYGIHSIRVIK